DSVSTTVTVSPAVPGSVSLTPGWATFGTVAPEGTAHGGLQLGNLVTQTDVKDVWPDGSIRYAIVTASVPTAGTYTLAQMTPSTGSFAPKIPSASVLFTMGGMLYTASLPVAPS